MTGPASGGTERGMRAPSRSTGISRAVGAIALVLAFGLALRFIIAYVLLPGSGFGTDISSFRAWAGDLAANGTGTFYDRGWVDYTPGYMYVLWLVGTVGMAFGGIGDLIKLPPIVADAAIGYLVWSMARELGARQGVALLAATLFIVNPVSWFDSAVWGQVDSFGVVFLLLGLRELWRDRPERAAILTVVAAVIKPQLGILVPLVAFLTIRRALWPAGAHGDEPGPDPVEPREGRLGRYLAWEARTGHPIRIVTTGLAGLVTAIVLCWPFGMSVLEVTPEAPFVRSGLVEQVGVAAGGYPYVTVNAYNPWALVPGDTGLTLARNGLWMCDATGIGPNDSGGDRCSSGTAFIGPVPAIYVGTALLLATIALATWIAVRHPDRRTLLVALAVLAIAFFVVPTRVHERYLYPFFALTAILAAVSLRWRVAYVFLSAAMFANLYVVLTTLYDNRDTGIQDWLGVGGAIRSELGVTIVAIAHLVGFLWVLVQLRGDRREVLADELADAGGRASEPPEEVIGTEPRPERAVAPPPSPASTLVRAGALGTGSAGTVAWQGSTSAATVSATALAVPLSRPPAAAAMEPRDERERTEATWRRAGPDLFGVAAWFRGTVLRQPIRADRTALLAREGRGRFDRLDLWLLVVLVVATLVLRTFRLGEPLQMHFDEVYHARTATEFLQHWRYGQSHDIYEWTHPHLGKYVIAGGIAAFGGDRVSGTSSVGAPVRDAVVEPQHLDPLAGGTIPGRVWLATDTGLLAYDLATRERVATVDLEGAQRLALDSTGNQLIVGTDAGELYGVDLGVLDSTGEQAAEAYLAATLDGVPERLAITDDGATVLVTTGDRLLTVDWQTGETLTTTQVDGITDVLEAGTTAALIARPGEVTDPAAVADRLAELITEDAETLETTLTSTDERVIVAAFSGGKARTGVSDAIAAGELPGVEIADLEQLLVARADGVAFLDRETGTELTTLPLTGGARGLTQVTNIDGERYYALTGTDTEPGYVVVSMPEGDATTGPQAGTLNPLPAPGSRIGYDEPTRQVHILGRTPDGSGWTVYVVEPHANAVYADVPLPFEPTAWAFDVGNGRPSVDRQQLLAFGADGSAATVELGLHAFGWRMPGVIAGSLMAGVLYLLTRILFRRRDVAVLVALFTLVDGMLFAQSRIAMNDVYVGLFIMAAYTVFAALWTGFWRGPWAFWVGMPVIGLLLGLGLASKWVAAYAIGALILLILVRSALGRVLAVAGMIGLTAVLGYMAISVPDGEGFGNVTFLLIMIALTLLTVVTTILHPIAWSDEELRVAVIAPAAAGAILFFGGLALGRLDSPLLTVGGIGIRLLDLAILLAIAAPVIYGLFRVAGRVGFGPLALPPAPDDPIRALEPPAPPPEGWLRPGWAFGIPIAWAGVCLVLLPVAVYIASYLPWAMVEGHQLVPGWPAGHTGQTLADLTGAMYRYHNELASAHAASSPWWAWPFDLKPVWFYQGGFDDGTSAAIYDAGNLVIWWLGVPAMLFVAYQAFRRRSLALALIAIGFAAQWIPWARIDRAAFQYHYYTALPFVVMALAYFLAELWHGASRMTWLLARAAAALAIVAPALMHLLSRPLCGFVRVTDVNEGSRACPAYVQDFVLTWRTAGLALVLGASVLVFLLVMSGRMGSGRGRGGLPWIPLALTAAGTALGLVVVTGMGDTPLFQTTGIWVEPIAALAAIPLGYLAMQVLGARDARRFVVGVGVAAVVTFLVFYPNISALPLPSSMVNAYQGLLPTYLYDFQFPVTTVSRNVTTDFTTPVMGFLVLGLVATCFVVAYSAWTWRLALAERNLPDERDDGRAPSPG